MRAVSDVAADAVRAWQRLVTAGLPAELRDRRRAEIESDLWESRHQWRGSDGRIALLLLWRLASGAPHDLAWRSAHSDGVSPMMNRTAAVLVGGLAIGALALGTRGTDLPDPPLTARSPLRPEPSPPPPPPGAVVGAAVQPAYAQVSYRFEGSGPDPVLTREVRPQYPPILKDANVRGTVVVVATLTSSGRVTGVRATKPSLLLTQAAVDAVQQWSFASAARDTDGTARTLRVEVSFGG